MAFGSNSALVVSTVAFVLAACGNSEQPGHAGGSGASGALGGSAGSGATSAGSSSGGTPGTGGSGLAGAQAGDDGSGGNAGAAGRAGMPASGGQAGTPGGNAGSNTGGAGRGGSAGGGQAGVSTGGASGASGGDAGAGAELGTPVEEGLAALPGDRQEHGVVAAHGEVYVLGGYAPDVTSSVIAYDPAKDSWRDVADFPSPFNHPAAGVVDDKIYVAGFYAGTSLTGPATGQTFVYDPLADSWQERKELPAGTERAGGCVAVLGTELYVFGGGNSAAATSLASVYDTVADTWRELPALPETREHCSAFASGGKLYIASGRTHTIPEFRPATLEFDPETEKYTEKTPIPTPRGGAAGAVLDGRLFLFGGEGADNNMGVFPDIEAYDAGTDTWEAFPPMLVPRHGYGAATLGDRIYLPGGAIRQGGAASDFQTVFYFE